MTENTSAILQERYLLKTILGKGGQATIFRAWDQELDIERAIKALSPEGLRQQNLRERFKAEAQVMAKLEHKGIVRVYDIVYGDDLLFIVMEILSGGNLWQWVKSHGAMPEKMACEALMDVAAALQVVHEKGIVHRDIKPHNMLLNQKGEVKLTDFGIAQFHQESNSDMTQTGHVFGTVGYMSPEQRDDSKQVTNRSDIYSLGACLFSLCRAKNPKDLFFTRHPEDLLQEFSPDIQKIILKACNHDPEKRYADAAEFCEALENAIPNLQPIPDYLCSLQAQAESMLGREDTPIDNDTMRSITRRITPDKTNPTLFFETMVNPDAGFEPKRGPATQIMGPESTIKTIEVKNNQMMMLISVLATLTALALGVLFYLSTEKQNVPVKEQQASKPEKQVDIAAVHRKATQICLAWAEQLQSQQHDNGGFSGIIQVSPQPWDTGQQLTSLIHARSCGFSATETWKKSKPQLKKWLQSESYPRNSFEASWVLIALADKDKEMAIKAMNWLNKFKQDDGSFGVYDTDKEGNAYATLLAAWALLAHDGEAEKKALTAALVHIKSDFNQPLSPGLDEMSWWIQKLVGQKHKTMGPSVESSTALAQRMITRCKAESPGGPCEIGMWPNTKTTLPERNGSTESIQFLGEPWAMLVSRKLQEEALPEDIKTQISAIERWTLSKRIDASPHILSAPGFKLAENLLTMSLLLE